VSTKIRRSNEMRTAIITIMSAVLVMSVSNIKASSPPWGGDEHYTFGDEDPFFAHGAIYESASVDIVGGSFGALHSFDYSAVYMTGGVGNMVWANDSSTVDLYGGSLTNLVASEESEITLYVDNYEFNPDSYVGYEGVLTGTWINNGGDFEIFLPRQGTLSHITFEYVPEPTTLGLLALGALFMRRWRN